MEHKRQRAMTPGASSSNSKAKELMIDVTNNLASEQTKISVLIVGEDSIFRRIHKAIIDGFFKMKEKSVRNGKEAVELYHSGEYFDIVFMDKDMAVMDGIEATKELRAMGVKSIIVGITDDFGLKTDEFLAAGLNLCLERPLTPELVHMVLEELNK